MSTFGDYETVGEPLAVLNLDGHISTVSKVQKAGAPAGQEFAVKCYAPRRQNKPGGNQESLGSDRGLEFLEGIKQIRKLQSGLARYLAPIHDLGISPEGAWYVTDFYPRGSLAALIGRRAIVDGAALKQIVGCVVAGCLALKKSRGISHGNLKASNIFLTGKPRPLSKTPMVLTDPFPAAPLQLARLDSEARQTVDGLLDQVMEVQDLRALGEIILQLVRRSPVRSGYDYTYPIDRSEAWENLGKDGERWRKICNDLLDPQLSPAEINLESLAKKFPAGASGGKAVGVTVVVLLATAGLATAFFLLKQSQTHAFEAALKTATDDLNNARQDENVTEQSVNNLVAARSSVERALKLHPQANDAVQLSDEIKKESERRFDLLVGTANNATAQDHTGEAEHSLKLALDLKPEDSNATTLLRQVEFKDALLAGRNAEGQQQWAQAATIFDQAVKLAGNLNDQADGAKAQREYDFSQRMAVAEQDYKAGKWTDADNSAQAAQGIEGIDEADKTAAIALQNRVATAVATETTQDKKASVSAALEKGNDAKKQGQWAQAADSFNSAIPLAEQVGDVDSKSKAQREHDFSQGMADAEQYYKVGKWTDADNSAQVAQGIEGIDEADKAAAANLRNRVATAAATETTQNKKLQLATALSKGNAAESNHLWGNAVDSFNQAIPLAEQVSDGDSKSKAQREHDFSQAMDAGEQDFKAGKWRDAATKAQAALAIKSNDSAALTLLNNANKPIAFQKATSYFNQCDYANALAECNNYNNDEAFIKLAMKISDEKKAFDSAQTKFAQGNYTFIAEVGSYTNKSSFSALLQQAEPEAAVYKRLNVLCTDLNNWSDVNKILIDPQNAALVKKQGFQTFRDWADKNSPSKELNRRLACFQVWFNLRKPDPAIIDFLYGKPASRLPKGIDMPFYEDQLKKLRENYIVLEGPQSSHLKQIGEITTAMDGWF